MAAQPAAIERAYGVTNIKSHIPITLDLDDHNYDAWRELFLTHCLTFDVQGHLDGTLLPINDNDGPWFKRDGLVKLWIYGTLAQPLFRSSFQAGGTARDVWLRIENQFRNNKEARAIQLDNELRTTEIGDLSIREYCQKMKSLADLLSNVDAPVTDRLLVIYLLNGLNEKFDNIINVIKHKEPFPSFEGAKSMLEMEEARLKKAHKPVATHNDHASSSTALTVTRTTPPVNNPSPPSEIHHSKSNNYRGNRKNNNRYRGRNNFSFGNPAFPYWTSPSVWPSPFAWPNQFATWTPNSQMPTYRGPLVNPATRPMTNNSQQAHLVEIQPTTLPQAYTTETLPDPNGADWYMDTGATAHLSATAGSSNPENTAPM